MTRSQTRLRTFALVTGDLLKMTAMSNQALRDLEQKGGSIGKVNSQGCGMNSAPGYCSRRHNIEKERG